jgi:hypothetical protein
MVLRKGEETGMKEGAVDYIQWRTHFGRGYGPAERQTTTQMKKKTCYNGQTCLNSLTRSCSEKKSPWFYFKSTILVCGYMTLTFRNRASYI